MYLCLSNLLRDIQNNWTVYIFKHKKLFLILSFLCSTAIKVTLHSKELQQTGAIMDGKKFTQNLVSSV